MIHYEIKVHPHDGDVLVRAVDLSGGACEDCVAIKAQQPTIGTDVDISIYVSSVAVAQQIWDVLSAFVQAHQDDEKPGEGMVDHDA